MKEAIPDAVFILNAITEIVSKVVDNMKNQYSIDIPTVMSEPKKKWKTIGENSLSETLSKKRTKRRGRRR